MQLVDDVDEPVAREVRERERLMRQLLAFRGGARRARPCTGRRTAGAARTHAHAQGQRSSSLGVGEAAGPAIKLLLEALSLGAACRFLARRAVE